jgi:hypothetical protein
MDTSSWSQVDAGVASALGAIVATAAARKLQHPRVFALTLERLDAALARRRALTIRLAVGFALYEAVVAVVVVAFRGTVGFVAAAFLLVACVGFLLALARAVQQSVPCACFGRLGRTAAGGREIGRGIVLVAGAAFLVVHRALAVRSGYGFGLVAGLTVAVVLLLIVVAQRIGATVRPGVDLQPAAPKRSGAVAGWTRNALGYDNDLYSSPS